MNCRPIDIRRPDPDETPLSAAEKRVAISRGWHASEVLGARVTFKRVVAQPDAARTSSIRVELELERFEPTPPRWHFPDFTHAIFGAQQ